MPRSFRGAYLKYCNITFFSIIPNPEPRLSDMKQSTLDPKVRQALSRGGTIDITTVGRKTGAPRRIEIEFHTIGDRIYISGLASPRRRSWLANLDANPTFTFHLKGAVKADL